MSKRVNVGDSSRANPRSRSAACVEEGTGRQFVLRGEDDAGTFVEAPTRLTANDPAWRMGPSAWLAVRGVHEPHIAEISPVQYARMSGAAKKRYDAKRSSEWAASSAAKAEWRTAVLAAYDRGEITKATPGLHPDALDAIRTDLVARDRAAAESKKQAAHAANRDVTIENVAIGDRLFDVLYRQYATVTKKFKTSVRVRGERDGKEYTANIGRFHRKEYNDVRSNPRRRINPADSLPKAIKTAEARMRALIKKAKDGAPEDWDAFNRARDRMEKEARFLDAATNEAVYQRGVALAAEYRAAAESGRAYRRGILQAKADRAVARPRSVESEAYEREKAVQMLAAASRKNPAPKVARAKRKPSRNPADSKKKAKASGPAHPATCDGGVDCMCEPLSENEIRWMRGVAVNGLPVTHARGAVGERLRQSVLSRGLAKHVGGPRHELTPKGIAALRAYGRFPERPLQARDFDYLSSAAVRTPHGIIGARQIGVDFSTGAATVVDSQTDTVRQYLAGEWEIVEFDSGGRPSRFLRAEDLPRSNPATRAKRATNPARSRARRKNAIGSAIAGGVAAGAAGAATSHALEKRGKRSSGIRPNPASTIRPADGSTINAVRMDALIASGFVNIESLTLVLEDGSRVRANRSTKMTSLLTPSINRITWVPLRQGGKWNRNLRRALKGKAGVYAIREAGSRTVLYVGEGGKRRGAAHLHSKDPDRLFRTILRHFQEGFTPERYALDREQGGIIGGKRARRGDGARRSHDIAYASSVESGRFAEYRAGGTEWTYHKRGDLEIAVYVTPPGEAAYHEGRFILELEPTGNIAFTGTGDAPFDYGDNAA